MRKIDIINESIENYRSIGWEASKNISEENRLLSSMREELEWQNLSAPEKQQKRKLLFRYMKKMETPIDELRKIFELEICIIDIYDMIQSVLDKLLDLEEIDSNKISVIRLKSMLFIEKVLINEFLDAKKIQHHNFKILSELLIEYSSNPDFFYMDLQMLNKKLTEKENLLNRLGWENR